MDDGELRLCYIQGDDRAYFTSQPLDKQWGDDWDDAPYEHNAGTPYEPHESYGYFDREAKEWRKGSDYVYGVPGWRVVSCYFEAPLVTPAWGCLNSPYSVQDINRGRVPWLRPVSGTDGPTIMAGVMLDEFRRLIAKAGGKVYLETPAPA